MIPDSTEPTATRIANALGTAWPDALDEIDGVIEGGDAEGRHDALTRGCELLSLVAEYVGGAGDAVAEQIGRAVYLLQVIGEAYVQASEMWPLDHVSAPELPDPERVRDVLLQHEIAAWARAYGADLRSADLPASRSRFIAPPVRAAKPHDLETSDRRIAELVVKRSLDGYATTYQTLVTDAEPVRDDIAVLRRIGCEQLVLGRRWFDGTAWYASERPQARAAVAVALLAIESEIVLITRSERAGQPDWHVLPPDHLTGLLQAVNADKWLADSIL